MTFSAPPTMNDHSLHNTAAVSSLCQIEALALRLDAASRAHADVMNTARSAVNVLRLLNDTPSPHQILSGSELARPPQPKQLFASAALTTAASNFLASIDTQSDRMKKALDGANIKLQLQTTLVDQFRERSSTLLDIFDASSLRSSTHALAERPSSLYAMNLRKVLRQRESMRRCARQNHVADLHSVSTGEKSLFQLDNVGHSVDTNAAAISQQLDAQLSALLRSLQGNLGQLRRQRAAVVDAIDQRIECLMETTAVTS
ncbi:Hypothetical protein, putative [Bodo saltans]|uniref:Uncharacterized protein n=1 Tax=Bodo saltans TaxID=75058 RepID=A0A0S4JZ13_BODSA|nr:Hypothetical protein, putative [Bodo saltans]|eukprot:CUG93825.1 Hypothetical protein, putative [Bodo saltans]